MCPEAVSPALSLLDTRFYGLSVLPLTLSINNQSPHVVAGGRINRAKEQQHGGALLPHTLKTASIRH